VQSGPGLYELTAARSGMAYLLPLIAEPFRPHSKNKSSTPRLQQRSVE
jgi:hypothetical protein